MRLKTFYAKTMTEAMNMVRDALGEDAIIVATREEQGGRRVRVTAAVDDMEAGDVLADKAIHFEFDKYLQSTTEKPVSRAITAEKPVPTKHDWLAYDEEEEEGGVAEILSEVLLRHAVSNEVMDTIVTAAMLVGGEDPRRVMAQSLASLFKFTTGLGEDRPLILVGSPGSGKTLAAAKLAAQWAMSGERVCVITTDGVRAGAIEQLKAFTRILSTPLHAVKTPSEMVATINAARGDGATRIIIDTGGGNPFDTEDMRTLTKFLQAMPMDAALVMPGGIDADESAEIARIYAILGVSVILPSRLDIARRLGGILAAAHKGGMAFAIASASAGVADGMVKLSPAKLADILMPNNKKDTKNRGVSQ